MADLTEKEMQLITNTVSSMWHKVTSTVANLARGQAMKFLKQSLREQVRMRNKIDSYILDIETRSAFRTEKIRVLRRTLIELSLDWSNIEVLNLAKGCVDQYVLSLAPKTDFNLRNPEIALKRQYADLATRYVRAWSLRSKFYQTQLWKDTIDELHRKNLSAQYQDSMLTFENDLIKFLSTDASGNLLTLEFLDPEKLDPIVFAHFRNLAETRVLDYRVRYTTEEMIAATTEYAETWYDPYDVSLVEFLNKRFPSSTWRSSPAFDIPVVPASGNIIDYSAYTTHQDSKGKLHISYRDIKNSAVSVIPADKSTLSLSSIVFRDISAVMTGNLTVSSDISPIARDILYKLFPWAFGESTNGTLHPSNYTKESSSSIVNDKNTNLSDKKTYVDVDAFSKDLESAIVSLFRNSLNSGPLFEKLQLSNIPEELRYSELVKMFEDAIATIMTSEERADFELRRTVRSLLNKQVLKMSPYSRALRHIYDNLSSEAVHKASLRIKDKVGSLPSDPHFDEDYEDAFSDWSSLYFNKKTRELVKAEVDADLYIVNHQDEIRKSLASVLPKALKTSELYTLFSSSENRYYDTKTGELLIKNKPEFTVGPIRVTSPFTTDYITVTQFLAMQTMVSEFKKSNLDVYYKSMEYFISIGSDEYAKLSSFLGTCNHPAELFLYARQLTSKGIKVTIQDLLRRSKQLEDPTTFSISRSDVYSLFERIKHLGSEGVSVFNSAILELTNELGSEQAALAEFYKKLLK